MNRQIINASYEGKRYDWTFPKQRRIGKYQLLAFVKRVTGITSNQSNAITNILLANLKDDYSIEEIETAYQFWLNKSGIDFSTKKQRRNYRKTLL